MTGYEKLVRQMQKIADINSAIAVLHWDQEVYLPPQGAGFRAQQIASLSALSHEMFVSTETGDLINQAESVADGFAQKRNVALLKEDYAKRKKYSTEFVQHLSLQISKTYHSWIKARKGNNFSIYEPDLDQVIRLKREECELLGYSDHPYDALMDEYEPKANTRQIEDIFVKLKDPLVQLVQKIRAQPQVKDEFMNGFYEKTTQWEFSLHLLRQMGYNFEAGRQDLSEHPFTIAFNPDDVRVTTRVNEKNLHVLIWSSIHEGGHALYEQGLSRDQYGLPAGSAASLSIHESQSRLYENNIGRSLDYWIANYNLLRDKFPANLEDITVAEFYQAINKVEPGLIRTEADELTYHLHILIRFEIEKALIEGSIQAKDLPAVWNKKYTDYLGINVPDDKNGVLQDIHWSHGSFGYFPTYTLGSLYAAQFFAAAGSNIPNLSDQIKKGELHQLLDWLRENIHTKGKLYTSEELCKQVTGEQLNVQSFLDYVDKKYSEIYGL